MNHFQSKNDIYLIAEIGGNHEGDFEYAKELTRLAAESGADAVKFQIYTGDTLVNAKYDPARNKHFKRFQLNEAQYTELAELCQQLGVTFMASVWDVDAIDYIDRFSTIYKIGSGDMTAYNVIKKTTQSGKPMILSTGLATANEVSDVVAFIEQVDPSYISERKLAILQCTSMYPILDEDANLNVMRSYMQQFDLPIGYSDHTIGPDAIEVAVAMGAEIIEVHFTDSREGKEFRDHKVSLTRDEIQMLIKKIGKIKRLQGSADKAPTPSEIDNGHPRSFRRAVFVNRNLPAGHVVTEEDLVTLRPVEGVGAEHFYDLVGVTLQQPMERLQRFESEQLPDKSSDRILLSAD